MLAVISSVKIDKPLVENISLDTALAVELPMPTEDLYSSGHVFLHHFETCMCSQVATILLNWSCFRSFEFRTFVGTSILLLRTHGLPFALAPQRFRIILGDLTDYAMHVSIMDLSEASLTSRSQLFVASPVLSFASGMHGSFAESTF